MVVVGLVGFYHFSNSNFGICGLLYERYMEKNVGYAILYLFENVLFNPFGMGNHHLGFGVVFHSLSNQ